MSEASSTPISLRSEVGLALDKTILGLLSLIDLMMTPGMRATDFYVGHGSIQSAHGIAQSLAETVETLMRARRLA